MRFFQVKDAGSINPPMPKTKNSIDENFWQDVAQRANIP